MVAKRLLLFGAAQGLPIGALDTSGFDVSVVHRYDALPIVQVNLWLRTLFCSDFRKMLQLAKLIQLVSAVRRLTGKPVLRQLQEILRLSTGKHRLGISEYYELSVFDDDAFPPEKKRDCIGWRASHAIDKQLNHNYWRAAANDKVLNYALLEHYRFPIPETVATYSPQNRRVGSEILLNTEESLRECLTQAMPFPVFIKPIHGSYGRGTFLLNAYDAAAQCFVDSYGKTLPLAALMKACQTPQYAGMLFQKCLQPHNDVLKWIGSTTSCVRVIVVLNQGRPRVHMAFWKIARSHNITDNFHMGSTGNLLAWVDKESGQVMRVVTGLWPSGQDVTQHPDTMQELLGKSLPDWQKAVDMCTSAAVQFPGLRLQHWDVAFCKDGPVLMELNTEADLGVPQFLGRVPFVDDGIRAML